MRGCARTWSLAGDKSGRTVRPIEARVIPMSQTVFDLLRAYLKKTALICWLKCFRRS